VTPSSLSPCSKVKDLKKRGKIHVHCRDCEKWHELVEFYIQKIKDHIQQDKKMLRKSEKLLKPKKTQV